MQNECRERGIPSKKVTSECLLALQCSTEQYVTELFQQSQRAVVHGKRITVQPKDLEIVIDFRGSEWMFKTFPTSQLRLRIWHPPRKVLSKPNPECRRGRFGRGSSLRTARAGRSTRASNRCRSAPRAGVSPWGTARWVSRWASPEARQSFFPPGAAPFRVCARIGIG